MMPGIRRTFILILTSALFAGTSGFAQGPLPADEVTWVHAPYEVGECVLCHEREDPDDPGPVTMAANDLCFQCHEEMESLMSEMPTLHFPAEDACTNCHNPHNAAREKGLALATFELCTECHDDIGELATTSAVQHGAVTQETACLGCHNPHGTRIEKLLRQVPGQLCLTCHSEDGIEDDSGKKLTNMGALIAANPEKHEPVAAGDCTACHQPHGGENFRLLVLEYPAKFYSPFDPKNYDLCFTCHDERMVTEAETTTLTNFRKGSKNLHFRHVNKETRGRTCRACHEVHAAENVHIIRNGVPYGSKGWILPLHYEPHPNGGQCSKTCHATRAYDRTAEDAEPVPEEEPGR